MTFLNVRYLKNRTSKYMKHKLIELQGRRNKSTMIVWVFNIPLSVIDNWVDIKSVQILLWQHHKPYWPNKHFKRLYPTTEFFSAVTLYLQFSSRQILWRTDIRIFFWFSCKPIEERKIPYSALQWSVCGGPWKKMSLTWLPCAFH